MATPTQSHTFLWHDYETFGINPRVDRPAQFAAIRTDADLNVIGEPLMLYCQPAGDYLPDPQSCLITGITPQVCLERGIPEHEFAAQIEQVLSEPGTIGVGYNTIRFDDEFTRFMLWRNLRDPYAREWQNNCGRWDLMDVVRTAYALRPEGMVWPLKDISAEELQAIKAKNAIKNIANVIENTPAGGQIGGQNEPSSLQKPSFKLEHLTQANGLAHEAAHDALSDVRATIDLARLIKTAQPRLFDFCLSLHKKDRVAAELGLPTALSNAQPFLHISGMFPSERGCIALMFPLAMHPTNKNELIAWDLAHDPRELGLLKVDEIRLRMFTKSDALPAGMTRLPIKTIHLNKSPIVISNLKTLSPEMAQKWGFDLSAQLQNAELASALPDMSALWPEIFQRPASDAAIPDVDADLYGGFVGNNDRRRLTQLITMTPDKLATARTGFDDERLEELVFRYKARNFPDILTEQESGRWEEHCAARLLEGEGGARSLEVFYVQINELSKTADARDDAKARRILATLAEYADSLA
ncbi:MAG: exodeoxyribonuclease I [Burkholderiaceae bacterium]|nr:exodeoxyribonuclease I [Burkholderiaceae bacterium]